MKNFLQKLKKLHFHDWEYFCSYKELEDDLCEYTGTARVCTKCGKKQFKERHCLGLNPPQYVISWVDTPKNDRGNISCGK